MALELWLHKYKNYQKSMYGVTDDVCLVFPSKPSLYSLSIAYCIIENHFSEVIRIMLGYILKPVKIN